MMGSIKHRLLVIAAIIMFTLPASAAAALASDASEPSGIETIIIIRHA